MSDFHRGGCSEERSRDDAHDFARFFQYRKIIGAIVDEIGFGLFVLGRQCYTALNAEELRAERAQLWRGALRMRDPAPCRHPVKLTRRIGSTVPSESR